MSALRRYIARSLAKRLISPITCRQPDLIVGELTDPYLYRWWVIPRNRWFNIYLHEFMRSDDDRALHDHPWWNVSLLLEGAYTEHTILRGGINRRARRVAGDLKMRTPWAAHRIELTDGVCWTLFITGPVLRQWGFHCPRGWVSSQDFATTADGISKVTLGCGEANDVRRGASR